MEVIGYGYSFVAKLSWKKIFFFLKNICVFYKIYIHYLQKKMFLYGKKNFLTEKNISENVKNIYLISETYFYTENVCYK